MENKNFACVVVVMWMVVLGALVSEAAMSCGEISGALFSCIPYLTGSPSPSVICCDGVKRVKDAASTTPDRQATCYCLKDLAATLNNLVYANAEALPAKCGVDIPYKISPTTDCATIQL